MPTAPPIPAPRPTPATTARGDERWLLLAILVSLVLHGGVMWYIHNKNLGRVDPSYLTPPGATYRIQRAPRDVIVEDPADSSRISEADSKATPTPPQRAAGEKALAAITDTAASPASSSRPEFRKPSDAPPSPDAAQRGFTPPKVDLPDVTRTHPTVAAAMANKYVPSRDSGAATPGAGGSARAASALDAAAGSANSVGAGSLSGAAGRGALPASLDGPGAGSPGTQAPPPKIDLTKPLPALPADKSPAPEILDDDFEYAVTIFEPGGVEQGYARIDITPKRTLRKLRTMPKDVVYVIDTSGSVPEQWVQQAVRGVRDSLASLNPGDRFNIVLFKDRPEFFDINTIQPADELTISRAQSFLSGARSGGNTDVNRALSRLLVRDTAVDRVYNLVLISDGLPTRGVMDTRELINLTTRDNDLAASIFCIGVGPNQNRELLNFLAYRNKGFSVFATDPNTLANSIRDTMSRLRYPIMRDVRFAVAGLVPDTTHPVNVPDIYQGQTFSIHGRFAATQQFTMRLAGHNGEKPLEFTFSRDLEDALRGTPAIATDWAFWHLHSLYSEMISSGDSPQLRARIDEMRKKYGLKTLY